MKKKDGATWNLIRSEEGPDLGIFKVRFDWVESPRNASMLRASVLETSDWSNVVPVTPEGKIVLVKQYRFGIGHVTTEIPGGAVDQDETPKGAVVRELREETGYTSENWACLGWVEPNPAFQNNRCYSWLARDAVKTHSVEQDHFEDVDCCEMTLEELKQEIREGRMRNSLTLLALTHVFDIWKDSR